MSETPKSPEDINIPDNIEKLVESIIFREGQRRLAFDQAVEHFQSAETEDEKNKAAKHILMMREALEEFARLYPEVIPPIDEIN